MERKIGEIFLYDGEWYQCVEEDGCAKCDLRNKVCTRDTSINPFRSCEIAFRSDGRSAIFKKLEKVGDPYTVYNGILLQPYRIFEELYINQEVNKNYIVHYIKQVENIIAIEIKQSKNMEKNKLNLKPFDIEAAKKGKSVCTRDERKVRILCYDFKQNEEYPILVAVEDKDGKESALLYSNDGISEMYKSSNNELAMLPEKKEGWAVVFKNKYGYTYLDNNIFEKKEQAERFEISEAEKVDVIKIEWEE